MKRSYQTPEEIEEEESKKKEKNRIYTDFKKTYNYDDEDDEDEIFVDSSKKAIECKKRICFYVIRFVLNVNK